MTTVAALSVPRVPLARAIARSRVASTGVMLAAAVAPFECVLPGSIAGFTLTTSEAAIVIAVIAAAISWRRDRSVIDWKIAIAAPLAALFACAVLAALLAPEFRAESIRVVARYAVAILLTMIVAGAVRSDRDARQVIAVLLAAGAIVGVIAVVELTQMPWVMSALETFRPGFHVVGGQLRATSTLMYPTIASMFLEIAFALGLAWIGASWLAFAGLSLAAAGVVATFTRAGLITMTASMLVYGLVLARRRGWSIEHKRLVMLALVIAGLVLMSRSPQMLVARMSTEGSQEWYGASYSVPQRLTLHPDSFNDVPVTITNDGRLTWQSTTVPPFMLSYHWLAGGSEELVSFDGLRTPFAQPVEPGDSVKMTARVRAPGYPGSYVLIWDVVQEHRTWLSLEGVYPGRSIVTIDGVPAGSPPPTHGRMPGSALRLPRAVLWSTAIAIAREHPVFGIGPDNFRHVYGRSLGLASWDERVHANNSYLEVLVGFGIAGIAALGWLIVVALLATRRLLTRATDARLPIVAGAAAACLAIAAHALVDSFLTFTATYVAFAIAAGVLFARPDVRDERMVAAEAAPCA